ncbi:unnamed protein product [Lymnaea stagnalis]|uniref:snRNA-activating protein complex subunit 4 n=1 Tax=Lymnaea stagnalis TaxID=6523 RepID=A0AAV2HRA5_LYMST
MSFNAVDENERLELIEDEEKIRTALQLDDESYSLFYSDSSDEDEEEEETDQLIIDLELQESENAETVGTSSSSLLSVRKNVADDNARNPLQLPTQTEFINDKASPENTLTLNRALQKSLMNYIENINQALEKNTQKQAKLDKNLTDGNGPKSKPGAIGAFRAPYFRDGLSYPSANEDVLIKKQSKDYDSVVVESWKEPRHYVRKSVRAMLQQAVVEDCLENLLKPYMSRMEGLIQKCKACSDELEEISQDINRETKTLESSAKTSTEEAQEALRESIYMRGLEQQEKRNELKQYQAEITQVEEEIKEKKNTPEEELLANVDSEKVDWMKISKRNQFGGNSSWIDCQKAWDNQVRPTLNTSAWSKEEENKLLDLVTNSETGNWANIAADLGSGRTPFQCFSHYQRNFNPELKPRPWTKAENEKLLKVTTNTKENMGYYSWRHVASMIESRSPIECMLRFNKIDPKQHHGKWSSFEDAKLLAAVEILGFSWSKISKYVGTRNMMQCRDRYVNCLAPNLNFTYFTYDEDLKLLKLYKQLGPVWCKMSPHFQGRTDSMLLGRHKTLLKWKEQKEWFDKQTEQTKRMLLGKSLTANERRKMEARAKDFFAVKLGVTLQDYRRQDLDRMQGVDPDIIPPRPPLHLKYFSTSVGNTKNLKTWANKISFHQRLTENLQRIINREKESNQKNKSSKCQAEQTQDIMEEAVGNTLETEESAMETTSKQQSRLLESLLNKAFLREGAINVQDLLKASSVKQQRKMRKRQYADESSNLDVQLRNIICSKKRSNMRMGYRRILERDRRPASEIEQELDELDLIVPQLLLKGLGTDVETLYNGARHLRLNRQKQRSRLLSVEEELRDNKDHAELEKALEEIAARTDFSDKKKEQKIKFVQKRMRKLRNVLTEKFSEEELIIETKLRSVYRDVEYMEDLLTSDVEVEKELPALYGNAVSSDGGSSSVPTTSVADTSSVLLSDTLPAGPASGLNPGGLDEVNTGTRREINKTRVTEVVPQGTSDVASPSDKDQSPKRMPRACRLANTSQPDPGLKKIEPWSQQKIADESAQLSTLEKKTVTDLPLLPPNFTTLRALRALLLRRDELISKAGKFYNPDSYKRRPQMTVAAMGQEDSQQVHMTDAEPGVWFLPTDSKGLQEQASQFEGFTLSAGRPRFDVIVSSETNRLKKRRINESSTNQEPGVPTLPSVSSDIKPFLCDDSHLSQKSSYSIVKAPSGSLNNSQVCFQKSDDHAGLASLPTHGYISMTLTPNSVTLVPSTSKLSEGQEGAVIPDNVQLTTDASLDFENAPQTSAEIDVKVVIEEADAIVKNESRFSSNASHTDDSKNVLKNYASDLGQVVTDGNSLQSISHCKDSSEQHAYTVHASEQNAYTVHVSSRHTACAPDLFKTSTSSTTGKAVGVVEVTAESNDSYVPKMLPKWTKKINRYTGVSGVHLPEDKARKLLSSHKLSNKEADVVIVGVDSNAGKIVHFKEAENRFEAFESIDTVGVEIPLGRSFSKAKVTDQREEHLRATQEQERGNLIRAIRQKDEYKFLLARFRALLMWPVVLSTVQPSAVPDSQSSATLGYYVEVEKKEKFKKMGKKGKVSLAQREHMARMRKASLESRRAKMMHKKQLKQLAAAAKSVTSGSRRGRKRKLVEAAGEGSTAVEKNVEASEKPSEPDQSNTSVAPKTGKLRQSQKTIGRPKGSKNKKHERASVDRPKRNVRKIVELPQKTGNEPPKQMPQWWKDAMLAAMVSKKELEANGETLEQVDISEDEDFKDKGNYSDDEWVQELRLQET